jgi:hypothetical protein
MLSHKALGSGLNALTVQAVCLDVASALTATGTTQSDAYALTAASNAFSTVAAGTGAVLYGSAVPGDSHLVYTGGANTLKVYPSSGCKFNAQATDVPMVLATNTACEFHKITTTVWTGILSA